MHATEMEEEKVAEENQNPTYWFIIKDQILQCLEHLLGDSEYLQLVRLSVFKSTQQPIAAVREMTRRLYYRRCVSYWHSKANTQVSGC